MSSTRSRSDKKSICAGYVEKAYGRQHVSVQKATCSAESASKTACNEYRSAQYGKTHSSLALLA